jgi:hypothetical protein
MANISLTLYTNGFFGSVFKSPTQMGSLSINNSVTNISCLGTFSIKKSVRVSHKMVLFTAHILAQNTPTTLLVNLSILLQLCVCRCNLLCLTRMGIKLCNSPPLPPLFLVVCTAMQMVFAWFADGSVCAKFQQCRPPPKEKERS